MAQTHPSGRFRDSKLVKVGVAGLVLGTGPLLLAVVISHLQGDPNPILLVREFLRDYLFGLR